MPTEDVGDHGFPLEPIFHTPFGTYTFTLYIFILIYQSEHVKYMYYNLYRIYFNKIHVSTKYMYLRVDTI